MTIKLVNRDPEAELLMEGRLDSNTSPQAEEAFDQTADRFQRVVLNMRDLEYLSSAGLRVIKKLSVKMSKKGGELVLTNVNSMIMEVFEITGFVGILKFE